MDVGVAHFFTDRGPAPAEFGRAAESFGLWSVFVPEHSHFPVERRSPYPDAYGGGEVPSYYMRTLDQIVTLSQIAAVTSRLRLGTGITLLAQHDHLWKAKELATLDAVSGGRLVCGVGYGWNVEEAEAHGVDWSKRFSLVRDKVAIMRALWSDEVAEYRGSHVSLAPSQAWPKPVQRPGPPVYLGAAGPTALKEAARWADGAYIIPPRDDVGLRRTLTAIDEALEREHRDRRSFTVVAAGVPCDLKLLEQYAELGVDAVTLWVATGDRDGVLRSLERAASTAVTFAGR